MRTALQHTFSGRWIGNAAEDGKMATVFARLKVPAPEGGLTDHGVHAFIVPIRDEQHRLMPGVDIKDCGYKVRLCLCTCMAPSKTTGGAQRHRQRRPALYPRPRAP